jgi:hypothetical protein
VGGTEGEGRDCSENWEGIGDGDCAVMRVDSKDQRRSSRGGGRAGEELAAGLTCRLSRRQDCKL